MRVIGRRHVISEDVAAAAINGTGHRSAVSLRGIVFDF
jgi:hypothetical protein